MPELPDVENVAAMLRRRTRGRRIRNVRLVTASTVRFPDPRTFTRLLRGRRIGDVRRRGKYLLIALEDDLTLVVHLRMTGDFVMKRRNEIVDRHTRVIFRFDDAQLHFTDQRRFGHMDLLTPDQLRRFAGLERLGIEPLTPEFTLERLKEIMRGRRATLKSVLLRQDLVAGIGNIYADEILWQARLHPARNVSSLRPDAMARLHRAIRLVLRQAIERLSRYRHPIGRFLEAREPDGRCPRCARPLRIALIAGRTTYFCQSCQH
jgi:formamidopyrimidine-DNA glycosylase